MSLTSCIAKAGPTLGQVDKTRILEAAAKHRAAGLSADEAGRKAVDEVAAAVQALIDGYRAAPTPSEPAPARPPSGNTIFTDDAVAAARARLLKNRGRLSSGIDPQDMLDGITLAGYHIERGARKFSAFARAMVEDLGDWVKPYLKSWYMATKYGPHAASFEGMSPAAEVESADVDKLETPDAASRQPDLEPDRPPGQEPHLAPPDGNGQRAAGPGDGPAGRKPGSQRDRPGGGARLRAGGPAVPGAASDPVVLEEEPAVPGSAAGSVEPERGDHADDPRAQSDRFSDPDVETTARAATAAVIERTRQQREAEKIPVEPGLDNIAATLPVLLPLQQKDVQFAEDRFAVPDGYGVLFTNGTGTGKTAIALGAIKRMVKQGKKNILVVVPSAEVVKGWVRFAPMLGLTVTQLKNTKDAGSGVVITTYANMRSNDALVTRAWDMVVADEAQALNQNAEGEPTEAALRLRALTMHPDAARTRTRMLHPELDAEIKDLRSQHNDAIKTKNNAAARLLEAKLQPLNKRFEAHLTNVQAQIEAAQGATRTRAMFLSATPFAYETSVKWGQGYLFDWNKGFTQTDGYNAPDAYQNFMTTNFGWHMKTGKLNQPDERKVNRSVMQRQFNQKLKDDGALAGRMLEVEPDYDRRFIAAQSGLGKRIDEGLQWFYDTRVEDLKGIPRPDEFADDDKAWESRQRSAMHAVREAMGKRFDYHSRMRLLESLKAEAAVPWIKGQMAAGRKVVVFHDLIQGQTHDPFNLQFSAEKYPVEAAVFNEWKTHFDDLVTRNWNMLKSPIETLTENFPGIGLLNGEQGGKARSATLDRFNSDDQGPMVLVVQAALEAGWSGHDTTGKYPRVLLNLGLPVTPTRSIQQEGRIYRVGQASNAMFRYMNTQTNWEFTAFASTIAKRASTAENLAMGSEARGLLDSYIESFEATGDYPAGHDGEGTGGKTRDRELARVVTEWDRAKTLYWAKLKKTAATKAREGKDWFATPEPLGMKMVEWLDLREGETSMEPSAGDGAIARWLPDFTKRIAVEPSPTLAPRLALVFDGTLRNQSFEDLHVTNKADGIVMNPPFGKGGSLAGPHLDKAFNQHLDEGGRLVALIPEGPAMDARLDKLLNGTHEAPMKPLATIDYGMGPEDVFIGDAIKTTGSRQGELRGIRPEGNILLLRIDGRHELVVVPVDAVAGVARTGKRTETVDNAQGARLVASIRLPADTFGRAGTKVATRIVIIDKLAKGEEGPARIDYDFSTLDTVEQLFEAIEHLTIPERTKPRPAELDADAPASADNGLSDVQKKPEPQAPDRAIKDTRTKEGIEIAQQFNLPVVEHTTARLNLLQGVILKHVTEAHAKEVDKFAFRKDGGVFVRVWELNDLLKKYPLPPPAMPVLSGITGPAIPGGIKAVDLRRAVKAATEHWEASPGMPKVRVVAGATDLPMDVQAMLIEMNALNSTRGLMMPDGRVFLVADRINNAAEGQAILFHETYGHFGLRAYLGDSYDIQMGLLRMANPKLAAEANAWYAAFGQHQINARVMAGMERADAERAVRGLAVEEALADRAGANEPPKGWKLLMARLQKALRAMGLDGVADMLERMTEAETHALLMSARRVVQGEQAHANTMSPALGGAANREGRLSQGGEDRLALDLSRVGSQMARQGYERTDVKRLQAARRLQAILADKEAGMTPEEFSAAVASLADQLADVSATKQANRLMTERQRGADVLREKLIRARRRGDLDEEAVGFGLWLVDKNPAIADDLSVSILTPKDDSPSGSYNPVTRVIRLFKESGNLDTVAHEILHHTERMMPPELQGPIRAEWAKALAAGLMAAQSQPKLLAALQEMLTAAAGNQAAHQRTVQAFKDGVLEHGKHYQLFNASEFWAVNGARILAGRYAGSGGDWITQARQWMREMVQYLRGALGLRSDAPVLRALANVTNPENFGSERGGYYGSEEMLSQGDDVRQSLGGHDPSIVLSQTPAASPAVPGAQPAAPPMPPGVVSRYKAKVNSALSRVDHVINGFGGLQDSDQYMADRYLALGRIAAVNEVAKQIRAVFGKASKEDKKAVYTYLTDKEGSLATIGDDAVRKMAGRVKNYINTVGDQLVSRGLIPEESREKYRDAYLPRMYLAHLLNDNDWRALGAGKKVSDLGYLKERKDIPQEIRDVILGEVKDPTFLAATAIAKPMRDMALLDWLGQISANDNWIFPKSLAEWHGKKVSVYWLKAEAEALRDRARHYPDPANTAKANAIAEQMGALASKTMGEADRDHKGYTRLPNTPQYGRLRGMLVHDQIYGDLVGTQAFVPQDMNWAQSMFGYGGAGTRLTQIWKTLKVPLNIPGQIRNGISNMVMLQLSGVPLHKFPEYISRFIGEYRSNGKYWSIAKKYGVTESTFQAHELLRSKRDTIYLERELRGMTPMVAIKTAISIIVDTGGDAYQFIEAMGKTIKIMDAMEREGMAEDKAAIEAQKWLFDYSMIDPNLRYLRNAPVGAPFVTYTTKVLPRLAEVALLHPQRFLPWVALSYGIQMLAQATFGGDDDDWDKLKKALPEWMQKKASVSFLPFRDDAGRLQAADLSYFFPWSQWASMATAASEGNLKGVTQGMGIFSGPVPSVITGLMTNVDSFTGRQIINPGDPPSAKTAALLAYSWDLMMPPMMTSNGVVSPMWLLPTVGEDWSLSLSPEFGGKLAQAVTGSTNKYGDERATLGQAAVRLLGLNVYGIDPVVTSKQNDARAFAEAKQTEDRLRQILSDKGMPKERRDMLIKKYGAEMKLRADKIEKAEVPEFAKKVVSE